MKNPKSSSFFQRPATKVGRWAGGLAILAMLMLGLNSLGLNPIENLTTELQPILVKAYDWIMLASMIAATALGVIALTARRERSWWVWLFLVPVLFLAVALVILLLGRFVYSYQPESAPTPAANLERIPVIFDDDGSPDGTSALLYLLSEPRAKLMGVSVSYGEAHPQNYIHYLGGLLERYGFGDVPLGAGQDAPLAGDNSFPEMVREASIDFWGFSQAAQEQNYSFQDSPELIVQTVMHSDEPVTLLVSGALTSLAQALQIEPGISENIEGVYIMGGAVYVPGNLRGLLPESENEAAEWNIYVDPQAASEVFASGLNLYLVPLDATDQVNVNRKDLRQWRKGGSIPDFAAEIYDSRMAAWGRDEIEMWDLVTAEIMMNPAHCRFTSLRLEVVTAEGNSEGQIRVVAGDPNVQVCLEPDGELIKLTLGQVFSARK